MSLTLNLGDKVWVAYATLGKESIVPCSVCSGQKTVIVNLGDGSQVQVDCDCCGHGFRPPTGTEKIYEPWAGASLGTVTGVELRNGQREYRVDGSHRYDHELFATESEALVAAEKMMQAAREREMDRRAAGVDSAHRSTTWKIGYHRRLAETARRDLAYHEGKVRELKAKRGGIEDE